MADEPTDPPADPPENVRPTNDEITDKLFDALKGDESLTDDDRKSIAEGLAVKSGGSAPAVVKPTAPHWTEKKLF